MSYHLPMASLDKICNSSGQHALIMDLSNGPKSIQGTKKELFCNLIIMDSEDKEGELKESYYEPQTGVFDSTFMMLLEMEYAVAHPSEDSIDWNEDLLIFPVESTIVEILRIIWSSKHSLLIRE
jgi:hypothetical protein